MIEAIDGAVAELVPLLGAKAACQAVGVPRASNYRDRPGDEADQPLEVIKDASEPMLEPLPASDGRGRGGRAAAASAGQAAGPVGDRAS